MVQMLIKLTSKGVCANWCVSRIEFFRGKGKVFSALQLTRAISPYLSGRQHNFEYDCRSNCKVSGYSYE